MSESRDQKGITGDMFTIKEIRFIEGIVKHGNRAKAVKDAGFEYESMSKGASGVGYKLMNVDRIQDEVQMRLTERSERVKIDSDYVLKTIKKTIEKCAQAKPVIKGKKPVMINTPDGRVAPAYTFDSQGVLKGCELLGKHLKLFTDKVEIDGGVTVNIVKKKFDGELGDGSDD